MVYKKRTEEKEDVTSKKHQELLQIDDSEYKGMMNSLKHSCIEYFSRSDDILLTLVLFSRPKTTKTSPGINIFPFQYHYYTITFNIHYQFVSG